RLPPPAPDPPELPPRAPGERSAGGAPLHLHVAHHERRGAHVVEDDERLGQHETQGGQPDRLPGAGGGAVDGAHPGGGEQRAPAAEEAREVRPFRRDRAHRSEPRAQLLERVARGAQAARAPALGPLDVAAARAEDRAGPAAEKAVAGPLLAALDRLEEEARVA